MRLFRCFEQRNCELDLGARGLPKSRMTGSLCGGSKKEGSLLIIESHNDNRHKDESLNYSTLRADSG